MDSRGSKQERVCRGCGALPTDPEERRCPADGRWYVDAEAADLHPYDPLLGRALSDKYVLVDVLGEGGFGTVYRAHQLADGEILRPVAVKVVRAGSLIGFDEAVARFRREAAAIARLSHPNVVSLYDFGSDGDGTFYMVLELIE